MTAPFLPGGGLKPNWLAMLQAFPDRFVVGSDQFFTDPDAIRTDLERLWNETVENHQRLLAQAGAGSAESVAQVSFELLDCAPAALRRPLALVEGRAYAAAITAARSPK